MTVPRVLGLLRLELSLLFRGSDVPGLGGHSLRSRQFILYLVLRS